MTGALGRITAYPEITPKMEFCPDWRPRASDAVSICDGDLCCVVND